MATTHKLRESREKGSVAVSEAAKALLGGRDHGYGSCQTLIRNNIPPLHIFFYMRTRNRKTGLREEKIKNRFVYSEHSQWTPEVYMPYLWSSPKIMMLKRSGCVSVHDGLYQNQMKMMSSRP